jgi:hypothetical protein
MRVGARCTYVHRAFFVFRRRSESVDEDTCVGGRSMGDGLPPELERLLADSKEASKRLEIAFARVADLRKQCAKSPTDEQFRATLRQAGVVADAEAQAFGRIVDEMSSFTGLSEAQLDELDKLQIPSDPVDRTARGSVTTSEFAPTGELEELVPRALDQILPFVDSVWLKENVHDHRLDGDFLSSPLSIFRGSRGKSERRSVHRFAQMIGLATDFMSKRSEFDWFAGALLVPQLASLGAKVESLKSIPGGLERLSSLWRLNSEHVDSTIYELVVGASCHAAGVDVEFLTPTSDKTPDIRVRDQIFPVVIECKRRKAMTDGDAAEDQALQKLYAQLRPACLSRDMTGVVKLWLAAPPDSFDYADVVTAAVQQRVKASPEAPTAYTWGRIAFFPQNRRASFPETRLYSPNFLWNLFAWNSDLPLFDGIICQVEKPTSLIVSQARQPLALMWANESDRVMLRRTRTTSALFGDAVKQIPPGEVGLVYLCYQEGDREIVADRRTALLRTQLEAWTHNQYIRVPAVVVTRLVPRPLGDGIPDLVETGFQYYSKTTGDPAWFGTFPTRVFTN